MSHRLFVRAGATTAAAALVTLAAGPAFAASPVAQASATALTLSIAGNGQGTGTYAVSNDGKTETTSGSNAPSLSLLTGQSLLTTGTLAQDAATSVSRGNGTSDACSGLAGPGATLAGVGNGQSCLTGGGALRLDAANIDLSHLSLIGGDLASGIIPAGTPDPLGVLSDALDQLLGPVSSALGTALNALHGSVSLDLGAVTGQCHATPTLATGRSSVAGLSLSVTLPGINTITIPVHVGTGENTKVLTNLDDVVDAVNTSLQNTLSGIVTSSNSGALGPVLAPLLTALGGGLQTLINALNDNLVKAIAPQLAPLEQNILDGTINETTHRLGGRAIDVTALDLKVLPAANSFIGGPVLGLQVGHVSCGPNSRVGAPPATPPTDTTGGDGSNPITPVANQTPTAVKSGIGSLEDGPSALALAALAGLALAGTGAGIAGFRRSLRQR